jgi:Icc-related predicted phosphoesterase
LKLSGKRIGLLLNFHAPILTKGIKRLINDSTSSAISLPSSTELRNLIKSFSVSLCLCGEVSS